MDTSFLTEDNGNKSTMRLMCMMFAVAAIVCGGWIIYAEVTTDNAMLVFGSFLGGALGGKVGQKFMEIKEKTTG